MNDEVNSVSTLVNEAGAAPISASIVPVNKTGLNSFIVQDQGLVESLQREIVHSSGEWLTTDEPIGNMTLEQIKNYDYSVPTINEAWYPSGIIESSQFLMQKFANIAYFNADAVYTLRVQASPFEQGALIMWYEPYIHRVSNARRHLNQHLASISTFPHVILNLRDLSRSVSLKIPYLNETPIQKVDHSRLGSVKIGVLMPLQSGNDGAKASYTLSCRFDNVKLYGMASDEGLKGETRNFMAGFNTGIKSCPKWSAVEAQSGEDEVASKRGIISRVSDTISNVADALHDVPIVSQIAKPVGWISRVVGGVASIFGFSRPTDLEKTMMVANVPARGYTNLEGVDSSTVLAAMPDNAITTNVNVEDEDEMSVAYIAKRPFIPGRAYWNVGDPYNTVIGEIPVHPCPAYMSTRATLDGVEYAIFQGPPSAYMSAMFNWWRGNMVVKLNFAKTQFHQGRLKVQYVPYGETIGRPIEICMTEIIDLSQVPQEGVTIKFPSLMISKWYSTLQAHPEDAVHPDSFLYGAGKIIVSVYTPLIAAETVAQSVGIYPTIHWEDFELAEPGTSMRVFVRPDMSISLRDYYFPSGAPAPITFKDRNVILGPYVFETQTVSVSDVAQVDFDPDGPSSGTITRTLGTISAGSRLQVSKHEDGAVCVLEFDSDAMAVFTDLTFHTGSALVTSTSPFVAVIEGTLNANGTGELSVGGRLVAKSQDGVVRLGYHVLPAGTYTLMNSLQDDVDVTFCSYSEVTRGVPAQSGPEIDVYKKDVSKLSTTMGESVVSLRALTRRATVADQFSGAIAIDTAKGLSEFTSPRQAIVDQISFLYRFFSGSTRYKFVCTSGKLVGVRGDTFKHLAEKSVLETTCATHVQDVSLNPIVEVTKPFYSPVERLAMSSNHYTGRKTGILFESIGEPASGVVMKAAGDDMNFSFLVGAPVFTVPVTAT